MIGVKAWLSRNLVVASFCLVGGWAVTELSPWIAVMTR